ncbi:hypothetical protein A2379_01755 [Candidatus Amesbacteria bacterium RIFOXYB1_FULL_47_13]|nr:MAG: hypothetical protein UW51_C0007G0058 [Candidatus Amesbacteria bacterium GW2011_GWA1_44_24]OGD05820.1 MAG: hypothetical protein A2379_01755 [Candidatus Amesbacteria bacterium RIFOXYB1_FULL_47_13]HBC72682.1 hypothetical protein [Candidatus Amesbacteria bacterium]
MSAFDRPHMIETDKNQIIEPGSQSDLGFLRSIRKTDHPWHAVWKQFTGERKALGQGNWCELNVAREINGLRREVQFATLSEWDFDFSKMPQVKEQSDQVAGRVARELIKLSRMENLKTINVRQLAKSEIIGDEEDAWEKYVRETINNGEESRPDQNGKNVKLAFGLAAIALVVAGSWWGWNVVHRPDIKTGNERQNNESTPVARKMIFVTWPENPDLPVVQKRVNTGQPAAQKTGDAEVFRPPVPWYTINWEGNTIDWSIDEHVSIQVADEDSRQMSLELSNWRSQHGKVSERSGKDKGRGGLVDKLMKKVGMKPLERGVSGKFKKVVDDVNAWWKKEDKAMLFRTSSPVRIGMLMHSGRVFLLEQDLLAEYFRKSGQNALGDILRLKKGDKVLVLKVVWVSESFSQDDFFKSKLGTPAEPWEPTSLDENALGIPDEYRSKPGVDIVYCAGKSKISESRQAVATELIGIEDAPHR